ncbi:MAG TPA: hypothetical protein VNU01_04815 [Egibacteraceae bacterium]|nr:hypothetical protein [Egibacteraceae bacterium]
MYRDDECAVCGESLPPDHLYCREHGAEVDDRLHDIGALLARLGEDVPRLARLLDQVAGETYDWLAEAHEPEADWPPAPPLALRVDPEDVDVDLDSEPGYVRVAIRPRLADLLGALDAALREAGAGAFAEACARAEGANATH